MKSKKAKKQSELHVCDVCKGTFENVAVWELHKLCSGCHFFVKILETLEGCMHQGIVYDEALGEIAFAA